MKITYTKEFQIGKPHKIEEIQPHPNTEGLDFDTFFDTYIKEQLEPIEQIRKSCIKRSKYIAIITVIICLLTLLIPGNARWHILIFSAFIGMGAAIITRGRYKYEVKSRIMNLLLSYLGDFKRTKKSEYSYKDASKIFEQFQSIAMMPYFNNPPEIDDCIIGTYKNIPVEIEEVRLTETREKLTTKGKETETVTKFSGLIFSFPQIKKNPATVITRNRNYCAPENAGDEVKLEDVEYQKLYQTSSNDQIEARVVLQPAFMERLKELDKKGLYVACCFQNEKVYIAIRTFKDMFEVPIYKSALDKENYREVINDIEDVLSIIDVLKIAK